MEKGKSVLSDSQDTRQDVINGNGALSNAFKEHDKTRRKNIVYSKRGVGRDGSRES